MIPPQRSYLEESARWRPDEVALRSLDSGDTLTYAELDEQANRFANALHDDGVRRGDRVGIALYNALEFPIALYGCHKRGVVPVAINYRFAVDDFAHVFDETNPELVVYDGEIGEAVERAAETTTRPPGLVAVAGGDGDASGGVADDAGADGDGATRGEQFADLLARGSPETPPPFGRDEDEISYMFYTSGTTGDPKAVAHSVRSGRERMLTSIMANRNNPATVCLLLLPFFHGGGMDSALRATVATGAELVVPREPSWKVAADAIEAYGVTDVRSVPTTLRRLVDNADLDGRDFSTLECWRVTGAVLTESLARDAMEHVTPNLYNAYGSSEAGTNLVLRPDDLPEHVGTVGRALIDNEVRVIELDHGREVPPHETVPRGEEGELIIRSPQLFSGYFDNETASRDRVRDGWYYTHDVAVLDEAGYLTIKGRTDDMILSGGELVSAVEVEEVLEAVDDVVEAIVVGRPHEEWGQVVTAVVAAAPGTDEEELAADLEAYCRDHPSLARYKRPRHYEVVDELAHNETGKKLRSVYQDDS